MRGTHVVTILAALAMLGAAVEQPARADEFRPSYSKRDGKVRHHRRRAERQVVYYEYCRGGWWQTLNYGQVRPRWAVQCRGVPYPVSEQTLEP